MLHLLHFMVIGWTPSFNFLSLHHLFLGNTWLIAVQCILEVFVSLRWYLHSSLQTLTQAIRHFLFLQKVINSNILIHSGERFLELNYQTTYKNKTQDLLQHEFSVIISRVVVVVDFSPKVWKRTSNPNVWFLETTTFVHIFSPQRQSDVNMA